MVKLNIKSRIIKLFIPIRTFYAKIYTFFLAALLGKVIILLNQIDHNIVDWIFYFFVFNPKQESVKDFYREISTQTMGLKLQWLKRIYDGDLSFVQKLKNPPPTSASAYMLRNNPVLQEIMGILDVLIRDTRNPLVHSSYFLGYGNEYEWKLAFHRSHFDKKKDALSTTPFTMKDATRYHDLVKTDYNRLMRLFGTLINETFS